MFNTMSTAEVSLTIIVTLIIIVLSIFYFRYMETTCEEHSGRIFKECSEAFKLDLAEQKIISSSISDAYKRMLLDIIKVSYVNGYYAPDVSVTDINQNTQDKNIQLMWDIEKCNIFMYIEGDKIIVHKSVNGNKDMGEFIDTITAVKFAWN